MAEYKDVIRVCDTKAIVAVTLREKMIGFATDTLELAVKAPGGTMYYFGASASNHFANIYVDDSMIHYGDDNTRISFDEKSIEIIGDLNSAIKFDYLSAGKNITINSDGVDVDVVINTYGGIKAVFVDGLTGRVGFGTDAPLARQDIYYTQSCSATNAFIYLRSGNVAHGITALLPTDVFASFDTVYRNDGGLRIMGISDSELYSGMELFATRGGSGATPATPLVFRAAQKNSTSYQAISTSGICFDFVNNTTLLFSILGDGTIRPVGGIESASLLLKSTADFELVTTKTGGSYTGFAIKVHDGDYTGLYIGNTGMCAFAQPTYFNDYVLLSTALTPPSGAWSGYGRLYAQGSSLYFMQPDGTQKQIAFV